MIIDLTYLKTMSNNDVSFMREMIEIFRDQITEYSEKLPAFNNSEDYDSLSKLAHKAKSSVAVMGMIKEADLLKKLEILAKNREETYSYKPLIDQFIKNANLAVKELEIAINE